MKILIVGLVAASIACTPERNMDARTSERSGAQSTAVAPSVADESKSGAARTTDNDAGKVKVLFFGTSLTAGYGLDPAQAFPSLIAKMAESSGMPIVAINAGLSGETSAGALRRIEWTMRQPVDVVVLETGGNDALRALDADSLKSNLHSIVQRIRSAQPDVRILLAVMEAPPNLGSRYTATFRKAYADIAEKEKLTLVPFLLDSVAGHPELNQADGVHPNEKGERIVADNVWRALQPVLREVYSNRPTG